MQKDLQLLVKKNKLFTSLKLSEALPEGIRGTVFELEIGDVLFRQNDPNKIIYLLLLGEINLISKEKRKTDYKDLYPGDFFSNYQLLDEPFKYITAVALKESKLLGIYKEDFDEILGYNGEIRNNIVKYFNGEFDKSKIEKNKENEFIKRENVEAKLKPSRPRFEVINNLDNDLIKSEEEKLIENKEAELEKIKDLLDTKISDLKNDYEKESKSRFKKIEAKVPKEEFFEREAAVSDFNKVLKKKEAELEKKQKLIQKKAEKQKEKIIQQKEKLQAIEEKIKFELTNSKNQIQNNLLEYQSKESKIKKLEEELTYKEESINKLIKEAETKANSDKIKSKIELEEIYKKEKELLKEKDFSEIEFDSLRDEFSRKERDLLDKSKELEQKEKELLWKIANIKEESIAERERLISEKEKILQLEAALLRREEELIKERESLKEKTKLELELKIREERLEKETKELNHIKTDKEKPKVENIKFEDVVTESSSNKQFDNPFAEIDLVVKEQEDEIISREKTNFEQKEKIQVEKIEITNVEKPKDKTIIKSDSEKLLLLSVKRDMKKMFSEADFKEVKIIFVNIPKATFSDAITFKKFAENIIEKNHNNLIIDFSQCNYIDSTFIGAVLTTSKKVLKNGGVFKLVISEEVKSSLIMLTQAEKLFSVFENLSDAYHSK